jgi:chemotaxis protein methyltransferase CheR
VTSRTSEISRLTAPNPSRAELLKLVTLLEKRHGVGARGDELPLWLEERLRKASLVMLAARSLDMSGLVRVREHDGELSAELANALRVGETRFYRDPAQWEALRSQVVPELLSARGNTQPLLALSAGCSTGEEAWTLAMLLCERPRRPAAEKPRVRVVGVDRSEAALVTARAATYDQGSDRGVPRELRQRFVTNNLDGSLRLVPELLQLVTFQCRDLAQGLPPGRFAVIVCKNVLIYFGEEAQARLVGHLRRSLTEDGVLLVARSEVPIVKAFGALASEIAPGITAFRG